MPDERPLRICFASLHYGRDISTADVAAYARRVPIHHALPRAVAARGHQVELIHLYPVDADFVEDGVRYRFVAPDPLARVIGKTIERATRRDPALYTPAFRAIRQIQASRPDVIHFHGITLNWNLFLLLRALGPRRPALVGHFHGGQPPANPLARQIQRRNFRRLDRLLFTTRSHAAPFVEAGMLATTDRVVECPETSSTFRPGDRAAARRRTGMAGDPVFLWVGRLDPVKDPLTALRGFARVAAARPGARLYLYYLTDELLPEARALAGADPRLTGRVVFRGRAAFEAMEDIYNSADFLLQASRREVCGGAILEALACGVIPVVTDIPSFRVLTDAGRHGVLFAIGDDAALARGVLAIPVDEIASRSAAARTWFERALSFEALAARLEAAYRELTSYAAAAHHIQQASEHHVAATHASPFPLHELSVPIRSWNGDACVAATDRALSLALKDRLFPEAQGDEHERRAGDAAGAAGDDRAERAERGDQ